MSSFLGNAVLLFTISFRFAQRMPLLKGLNNKGNSSFETLQPLIVAKKKFLALIETKILLANPDLSGFKGKRLK